MSIVGVRLVTIGYDVVRFDDQLDGSGNLSKDLGTPGAGRYWLIDRLFIETASTLSTDFRLYATNTPQNLTPVDTIEFTDLGNENVADENSPPMVRESARLVARWTGGTANAKVYARIDYRIAALQQIEVPERLLFDDPRLAAMLTMLDP